MVELYAPGSQRVSPMTTAAIHRGRAAGHLLLASAWVGQVGPSDMGDPQAPDCVTPEFIETVSRLLKEDLGALSPEQRADVGKHAIGVRCQATPEERVLLNIPPNAMLLGLWRKTPATIVLYEGSIRARANLDRMPLAEAARDTLRHEIGHALGVLVHNGVSKWMEQPWGHYLVGGWYGGG